MSSARFRSWAHPILIGTVVLGGALLSGCKQNEATGSGGGAAIGACTADEHCSDNNACTTDACNAGTCKYTAIAFDDNNKCTVDSCDWQLGVKHENVSCSDGSVCTEDACDAATGKCTFKPLSYFADHFDADSDKWISEARGDWQIGPAIASDPADTDPECENGDPGVDADGKVGGGVAGVVLGGPYYHVPQASVETPNCAIEPARYLQSREIDLSGVGGPVYLTFDRYLQTDFLPWASSTLEVYDGTKWVMIFDGGKPPRFADQDPPRGWPNSKAWPTPLMSESYPCEGGAPPGDWPGGVPYPPPLVDNRWKHLEYDVTPYKNQAFKFRFGYQVFIDPWVCAGWNIDNVRLIPHPACPDVDLSVPPGTGTTTVSTVSTTTTTTTTTTTSTSTATTTSGSTTTTSGSTTTTSSGTTTTTGTSEPECGRSSKLPDGAPSQRGTCR